MQKVLLTILVIALVLRIPHLGGSFWLDEAAQALESARLFSQQHLIRADFQPPLIHYLTHFALFVSHKEWWLRTIAALIPGLLTIYVFFHLSKRWFDVKIASISSLLLATSSLHIFYSQELRPYSLPAFFAVSSWFFLDRLVSYKKNESASWLKDLILFALTTTLGLYASYLYPFVVIGQLGWIWFFHHQQLQKFLTACLISALTFLPWLPNFLGQLEEGSLVRDQLPGWDQVVSLTQGKAIFLTIGKFIFGLVKIDPSPLVFISLIALGLVGLCLIKDFYDLYNHKKSDLIEKIKNILPVLTALFVPLISAWLVSFFVPVLSPKRVLYLLPFFYLFLSLFIDLLPKKRAPIVLILTLLTINLVTTSSYYFDKNLQREDWRSLHQKITTQFGQRRSIAIFSHPEAFSPWRWYDDGRFPTLATGTLSVTQIENPREHFKIINNYDYILVFDYLRTLSDPENLIISEVESYGFKEIEAIDTPNIGFVRVFARPEATLSSHAPSQLR